MKPSCLGKCFLPWKEFKYQVGRQHRQAFFSCCWLGQWKSSSQQSAIEKLQTQQSVKGFPIRHSQDFASNFLGKWISVSILYLFRTEVFTVLKKSVSINSQQFTLKCWSAMSTFQNRIPPHQSPTKGEGKAEYYLMSPKTETDIGGRFEREACGAFWFYWDLILSFLLFYP